MQRVASRSLGKMSAFALVAYGSILGGSVHAHEFWIDPVTFTPKLNATVPIVFRIGVDFKGDTYPFERTLDRGFGLVDGRGRRSLKSVDGDDPATKVKFTAPGLATVWHRRAAEIVTFETMAKFEASLIEEGYGALAAVHRAAGRPLTGIREAYTRHAKTLVRVGDGTGGQDRAIGMLIELVAEQNPYTHAADKPLTMQLLYAGKPLASTLVKVIHRDDPLSPRRLMTDQEGRVAIDVTRPGEYLVNAVHMLAGTPADKADWVSHWASLTFLRQ